MATLRSAGLDSLERFHRIHTWVRRIIAFLFFSSLLGLANVALRDMGKMERQAAEADFFDAGTLALRDEIRDRQRHLQGMHTEMAAIERDLTAVTNQIESRTKEFSTWKDVREATNEARENGQLHSRVESLDTLRARERELLKSQAAKADDIANAERILEDRRNQFEKVAASARDKADRQNRHNELVVFAWRLGLTLPILALGIVAFVRWRGHKFAPLAWGFIWFSVYVFFFELVPYLPSFGGYLRYGAGVVLVAAGGVYAVRGMSNYLERKRKELADDRATRAKRITAENAILAFRSHSCPSCGQDYLLAGEKPEHCFHCGLRLFEPCRQCGHVNFSFFSFCSHCGGPQGTEVPAVVTANGAS